MIDKDILNNCRTISLRRSPSFLDLSTRSSNRHFYPRHSEKISILSRAECPRYIFFLQCIYSTLSRVLRSEVRPGRIWCPLVHGLNRFRREVTRDSRTRHDEEEHKDHGKVEGSKGGGTNFVVRRFTRPISLWCPFPLDSRIPFDLSNSHATTLTTSDTYCALYVPWIRVWCVRSTHIPTLVRARKLCSIL